MRWHNAETGMVALMLLMTGCPSGFGKDGRIAKASHQDTLELVRKRDCDRKKYEEFCGGDRYNTPECIKECG